MVLPDIMADGVEKMGFPEANTAVDEEGVVRLAGMSRDAKSSRFDVLIRGAFDEVLKRVMEVELEVVLRRRFDMLDDRLLLRLI